MRYGRGKSGSRQRRTKSEPTNKIVFVTAKNSEIASSFSNVPIAARTIAGIAVKARAKTGVPPLLTVVALLKNIPSRPSSNITRGTNIKRALIIPIIESKASAVKICPLRSPQICCIASAAANFEAASCGTGKT